MCLCFDRFGYEKMTWDLCCKLHQFHWRKIKSHIEKKKKEKKKKRIMLRMFTRSLRLIVYQSHTIHQGSYIFHGIQTWCINENWNQNISNYLLKPRKERELKSWRTGQNFQREYRIPLYNTSQWLTAFIFNISNRIILNIMMPSAPNSLVIMQ